MTNFLFILALWVLKSVTYEHGKISFLQVNSFQVNLVGQTAIGRDPWFSFGSTLPKLDDSNRVNSIFITRLGRVWFGKPVTGSPFLRPSAAPGSGHSLQQIPSFAQYSRVGFLHGSCVVVGSSHHPHPMLTFLLILFYAVLDLNCSCLDTFVSVYDAERDHHLLQCLSLTIVLKFLSNQVIGSLNRSCRWHRW